MSAPLPVTIIGGYLGAGKTTLVNQMLRQANGTKLAVLVNEFGALPIDEDLIEAQDDELISIAGGCICCSFGSDLTAALIDLSRLDPPPDHLIIESSGVALPGSIALSISILDGFRVDGICVLADATGIRALAADDYIGDTIDRQLNDADLAILTKTDLLPASQAEATERWLTARWPDLRRLTADHGHVPNELLLGQMQTGPITGGDHADLSYTSLVLTPDGAIDTAALARALTDPALGVIRAKGHLDDISGKRALIQLVGPRAEVSFPTDPAAPGLVCIGLKDRLDIATLQRLAETRKLTGTA